MTHERIYFYPEDKRVYLDTYIADERRNGPRDAMVIFPGGAYIAVCADREGEPIAISYLSRGINSFVVKYSNDEDAIFPRQLLDGVRAVVHVKENAEKYNIDPERVFVSGFSAGGHLAGTVTTLYKYASSILGCDEELCKVRGAVLAYPVVSAYPPTHITSIEKLFKKSYSEISEEEKNLTSLERNIDEKTPPMFIWHTATDQIVPPYGSIMLTNAYCNLHRSVAFHLYPYGLHGAALANEITNVEGVCKAIPEAEGWLEDSVFWMKTV